MLQGIDHIVIVVSDLEQAAKDYEQLGFTVVPGGKHPVGSHNVLIALADGSYIEIIAFYREAIDHRWWDALQKGERLVDFCMQTDDLKGDTLKLRGGGVAINDPVPWSRTRPDGYELKWLLSLAQGSHRGVAPFLIQDVTPRKRENPTDVRSQEWRKRYRNRNHCGGRDHRGPTVDQRRFGSPGMNITNEKLQAKGVRYPVGQHTLDFLMPLEPQVLLSIGYELLALLPMLPRFTVTLLAPAHLTPHLLMAPIYPSCNR